MKTFSSFIPRFDQEILPGFGILNIILLAEHRTIHVGLCKVLYRKGAREVKYIIVLIFHFWPNRCVQRSRQWKGGLRCQQATAPSRPGGGGPCGWRASPRVAGCLRRDVR